MRDNPLMRALVIATALCSACGGSVAPSDGGTDGTNSDAKPLDAAIDVADASVPTITLAGTTLISPGGATLTQVTVCVFEHPELENKKSNWVRAKRS